MGDKPWRARSSSDKTDDWPFWYLTDDTPPDRNGTLDLLESLCGFRPVGLPFVTRDMAEQLAAAKRQKETK